MIKVIRCNNNGRSTHPFRKLHIPYYYTRKVSYFNNMIWRSTAFPVTLRTLYQYIDSLQMHSDLALLLSEAKGELRFYKDEVLKDMLQ